MDITALGTNGYLRVHDFVIPFQEKGAPFYEASNSRFAKLSIGIEPVPSEHVIDTDLPLEALMVREFAILVAGINKKRKTQLAMDGVMASSEKGFEPVEVVS
ncbi:unnamed protein product [Ilex paraguariensis]|uniref:Uncharacterized protein n=1 Tax=Ilex paraguariensis TaxID=185542 RepID=A0ABC8TLS5_9AQUA